jgi:hypothetical protein
VSGWRTFDEHIFPWDRSDLVVVAFAEKEPTAIDIFCVHVGEHGALFTRGSMLSLNEQGWIPFAWREDDLPARNDTTFPPMWKDYLTETDAA